MSLTLSRLDSPVGPLVLATRGATLCLLEFDPTPEACRARLARTHPGEPLEEGALPAPVAEALAAYFAGQLTAPDALAVETVGTPFQREVWAALRRIPAGDTASYAQLAQAVGRPSALRAVGAANGQNPVALVVPCHRVIAADGTLGGFAGGLSRKAWLLEHERRHARRPPAPGGQLELLLR